MQEKEKNVSTVEFLTVFGKKKNSNEHYFKEDDCCDQRAPLNNPEELYNSFVVPSDVMDEMNNEGIADFENDFVEYDDRLDYGADIAAYDAAILEKIDDAKLRRKKSAIPSQSVNKSQKPIIQSNEGNDEALDKVNPGDV